MIALRPDNRPDAVVWYWFEKEFSKGAEFPSVSWALGSDWGVGTRPNITAAEYKQMATARMEVIYGPRPKEFSK
jgi:hypothetical protein